PVADMAAKINVVFALVVGTVAIVGVSFLDQAITLFRLMRKADSSRKMQFVVRSRLV
ncbi:hypothetical protein CLU79DRAFT_711773, partial [Phycomyces nitens]